jgi:hypothetical protein
MFVVFLIGYFYVVKIGLLIRRSQKFQQLLHVIDTNAVYLQGLT